MTWSQRAIPALALAVLLVVSPVHASAEDLIDGVPASELGAEAVEQAPLVFQLSGVLVTSDGRELWARKPEQERAMASTTKIMTAVVVLENAELDELVTVSQHAVGVGESAAGLRAGDVLSVSKMLEAMLVKSGNEAATALAEHVGGSEEAFVEMMNMKAAEMGLSATRFANPHGLDALDHHTTARDLATVSRYAMGIDEFKRIVGLESTTITAGGGSRTLSNSNRLIKDFPGATGVKTGWTNDAGYCLVGSAEREGQELTAVVLAADSEQARFVQAAELLSWGFAHYEMQVIATAEETMGVVPVADYLDVEVGTIVSEDVEMPVFDLAGEIHRTISLAPSIEAPVSAGDRVGTLTVAQGSRLLAQVPVVAAWNVEEPGFFEGLWIRIVKLWRGVFGEPTGAPA